MDNHKYDKQVWVVVWGGSGKTQQYVPYDSIGMTSFIKQGLKYGKVTVNGREVFIDDRGYWRYVNGSI